MPFWKVIQPPTQVVKTRVETEDFLMLHPEAVLALVQKREQRVWTARKLAFGFGWSAPAARTPSPSSSLEDSKRTPVSRFLEEFSQEDLYETFLFDDSSSFMAWLKQTGYSY